MKRRGFFGALFAGAAAPIAAKVMESLPDDVPIVAAPKPQPLEVPRGYEYVDGYAIVMCSVSSEVQRLPMRQLKKKVVI